MVVRWGNTNASDKKLQWVQNKGNFEHEKRTLVYGVLRTAMILEDHTRKAHVIAPFLDRKDKRPILSWAFLDN